jgi:ATPase subunit of ABC transporter with duplicated ATPase domains
LALASPPLLSLKNVSLTFGGAPVLSDVELTVGEGERLALVGRNGSGKSTLLKLAAGLIEPDRGERVMRSGTTVRYLPQEPDLAGYATTLAFVEAGLAPGDEAYRAQYLLSELGLTGGEDPTKLSGGEARRAALARTLAPEPDILILDEPTNHLDLPAIEWLESELSRMRSGLVLVSHDRRFLQKLSRATLWLDRGAIRRLDSGFGDFEAWRDIVLEQEERDRHKLDRKIAAGRALGALRSHRTAQAQPGPHARAGRHAPGTARGQPRGGHGEVQRFRRRNIRQADPGSQAHHQGNRGPSADRRPVAADRARRPPRRPRAERRGQDDLAQHPDRCGPTRQRDGAARR